MKLMAKNCAAGTLEKLRWKFLQVNERLIRTFCWHSWGKWSDSFTGTWVVHDRLERTTETIGYMSQRRTCKKCGKTSYRKCT